jgi:hypothetical protein
MPIRDPVSFLRIFERVSVPEFVKRDYPVFVAFLAAYYTWLEEEKGVVDIIQHLRDYRFVDTTLDEFLDSFREEFLVFMPPSVQIDTRLLVKNIKAFYNNKGNEQSYRFLFKILFGEDIEFYYPKEDILRASDGKWYVQQSLKVIEDSNNTDNLLLFELSKIEGETSGAQADCERVLKYDEAGRTVYELFIVNVRGTFQQGETITATIEDSNGEEVIIEAMLANLVVGVEITNGGGGYEVGDIFVLRDGTSQNDIISTGTVSSIVAGPIAGLTVGTPGLHYNGNVREVSLFRALNMTYQGPLTIKDYDSNGDLVEVFSGTVDFPEEPFFTSDSNGPFDYTQLSLQAVLDPPVEFPGTGDPIIILDNTSLLGGGATGVISKVGNFGEILEVEVLTSGDNYQSPFALIQTETGSNGLVNVTFSGGTIVSVNLDSYPIAPDDAQVDFTDSGNGDATGEPILGVLSEYPGRWLNTDGFLSSDKVLQDNFFYQDFSYVIRTGTSIEIWRDIVKKIIHPAGLAFFGEVLNISAVDSGVSGTSSLIRLYTKDSDDDLIPILDSDGNQIFDS